MFGSTTNMVNRALQANKKSPPVQTEIYADKFLKLLFSYRHPVILQDDFEIFCFLFCQNHLFCSCQFPIDQ